MSLQKKLEKAQQEGFKMGVQHATDSSQKYITEAWRDGIRVGADAMNESWISVIENTKGIGPKLKERILEECERQHQERMKEREELMEKSEGGTEDVGSGTEHQDSSVETDERRIG